MASMIVSSMTPTAWNSRGFHAKEHLPLGGKRPLKTQDGIQRRFAPSGGRFSPTTQPFSVKFRKN
jgi:hypothetical protein